MNKLKILLNKLKKKKQKLWHQILKDNISMFVLLI